MAIKQTIILILLTFIAISQFHSISCHSIPIPKSKNSKSTQNHTSTIISSLKNNHVFSIQAEKPLSDDPSSYWFPNSNGFGFQSINLGSSTTSPCATVLTTTNCVLHVPDDSIHKDIQSNQFVFTAGFIKDQCSLTIQDCAGSYSFTNYLFPSASACNTAASVCCECNGCSRSSFPLYENSCALLFEHAECSLCNGFRLEVTDGDEVENLSVNVDNTVSSIYVLPQCELTIYHDPNFQGYAAAAFGSFNYLPFEWNDVISSYKCKCHHNGTTKPTAITIIEPTSKKVSTVRVSTEEASMEVDTSEETTTLQDSRIY